MRGVLAFVAGSSLLFGAASAERAAAAEPMVDLALVLAGDVSGSMTPHERQIEREGLVEALRDPSVVAVVRQGVLGRVAITYVEWAGPAEQWQLVPWTIVGDAAAADAFAAAVARAPMVGGGLTSLSDGLLFSARLLRTSGVAAGRAVIDVSGDGPNNAGPPVAAVRDAVVRQGITINGLPLSEVPGGAHGAFYAYSATEIGRYFGACVIGGPGAFVMPVTDPPRYATAMRRKLLLEIAARASRIVPVGFMMRPGGRADCDAAE